MEYCEYLIQTFRQNAHPDQAKAMAAYMKDQFAFLGIKSPQRNDLLKPFFLKENRPSKQEWQSCVRELWQAPEREFQYAAMELAAKYQKQWEKGVVSLFEWMVRNKPWWDTVDFIASNLVGPYFRKFPEGISSHLPHWSRSGDLWLERTAILFQLKYRLQTDTQLLESCMFPHHQSKEFFHRKAIGWALREYSKCNPEWVLDYLDRYELSGLSRREAMKWIERKG